MSDDWGDYAKEWDNPDTRQYSNQAFDSWSKKVAPLIPNLSESRVLDFGCGTGLLTEKLVPLCDQVVGVDTSSRMIEELQQKIADRPLVNVIPLATAIDPASVEAYPELASKFDMIVASSVCSFLPDYPSTLQVLSSLLRKGGIFVQWDWPNEMPADRITDAFDSAQLDIVRIEEDFEMTGEGNSASVMLGIGRRS